MTSLIKCWEKGVAAIHIIALEGLPGKGNFSLNCNEHREQVEASIGRREVPNDPGKLRSLRRQELEFIVWEIGSYLVCDTLLLHPNVVTP